MSRKSRRSTPSKILVMALLALLLESVLQISANADPLIMLLRRKQALMTMNPANWTMLINNSWTVAFSAYAGGFLGKSFNFTSATNGETIYQWNPAGTVADGEILYRFNATNPGGSFAGGERGYVRMTPPFAGGTGNAYLVTLVSLSGLIYTRISILTNNTGTSLATAATALAFTTGKWYWCRFRFQGSTLQAKTWADGSAEPSTWDVSATDTTYTTGSVGFGPQIFNWSPVNLDYFSYASGTGSAPGP